MSTCERCNNVTTATTMSWFNTQMITDYQWIDDNSELEQLILALSDPTKSDDNKIAIILDSREPINLAKLNDEIEFFISAVQAGDT